MIQVYKYIPAIVDHVPGSWPGVVYLVLVRTWYDFTTVWYLVPGSLFVGVEGMVCQVQVSTKYDVQVLGTRY